MRAFSTEELDKLLQDALRAHDALPAEQRALSDLAKTVSWVCGELRLRGRTSALSRETFQHTVVTSIRHHIENKLHPIGRGNLEVLLILDAKGRSYAEGRCNSMRALGLIYPLSEKPTTFNLTWLGKLYLNWLAAEQDWDRTESPIPANLSWRTVEAP